MPFFFGSSGGQGKLKSGTLSHFRLHPNRAAVVFDDLLANGQTNAVAWVFAPGMQALEDDKDVSAYSGAMPMPLSLTLNNQLQPDFSALTAHCGGAPL